MCFRIVYFMNVDWDWAKQRPHFIALHLSRSHEMIILYPFAWRRSNLSRNERDGIKLIPIFRIPFGGKFVLIRKLNSFMLRFFATLFIGRSKPDIVWISSPEISEYLPNKLSAKLIYDCMDDVLAFPANASRITMLKKNEKQLINASSHVFCSSENLRNKLILRAGHSEKYSVVHNAFEPSSFPGFIRNERADIKTGKYVLGYVGTISSWMDFEALFMIVNKLISIEIHLMGPIENLNMPLPQHERIKYRGTVKHGDIYARTSEFDAFIMPFKVSDLIQSVDPVKLYEYVFFNKPIVSVWYQEIERFSEFVDFYSNHNELIMILKRYLNEGFGNKYSQETRVRFISANTWAQRVANIETRLNQLWTECRAQ